MTIDFKALAAEAAKLSDHTEVQEGFDFDPAPEGKTTARLVEYIELGVQKRKPHAGKERKPVSQVRLTFELLGQKNVKEIEVDGVKKTITDRISLPPMTLSTNEKATFKKLFDKMRYGRDDVTHMSQLLDDSFVVTIKHNKGGKDNKTTYANIDNIESPRIEDPITGESKIIKVIPAIGALKMFIFDIPNKECWDSLFIDGERDSKDDDGKEIKVSKNYIQNMIRKADNFKGSAVEQLLSGLDDLPEFKEETKEVKDKPKVSKKKEAPVAEAASEFDLAELDM